MRAMRILTAALALGLGGAFLATEAAAGSDGHRNGKGFHAGGFKGGFSGGFHKGPRVFHGPGVNNGFFFAPTPPPCYCYPSHFPAYMHRHCPRHPWFCRSHR